MEKYTHKDAKAFEVSSWIGTAEVSYMRSLLR